MKGIDKKILAILFRFLPDQVEQLYKQKENQKELSNWMKLGEPIPPPHIIKQLTIKEYQKQYKHEILIETGTYMGDMVYAQKKNFNKIYSIELSEALWKKAVRRFKRYPHIQIIPGDSGKVLGKIISEITSPGIFWLDGHYSAGITAKGEKECPIFEELQAILISNYSHILLIDDARCFNGTGDYPTLEELFKFIQNKRAGSKIEVITDIVRVILN